MTKTRTFCSTILLPMEIKARSSQKVKAIRLFCGLNSICVCSRSRRIYEPIPHRYQEKITLAIFSCVSRPGYFVCCNILPLSCCTSLSWHPTNATSVATTIWKLKKKFITSSFLSFPSHKFFLLITVTLWNIRSSTAFQFLWRVQGSYAGAWMIWNNTPGLLRHCSNSGTAGQKSLYIK